jgi:hypothetical protein
MEKNEINGNYWEGLPTYLATFQTLQQSLDLN